MPTAKHADEQWSVYNGWEMSNVTMIRESKWYPGAKKWYKATSRNNLLHRWLRKSLKRAASIHIDWRQILLLIAVKLAALHASKVSHFLISFAPYLAAPAARDWRYWRPTAPQLATPVAPLLAVPSDECIDTRKQTKWETTNQRCFFYIIQKILYANLQTLVTSQTLQNRTAFQALGHGRQGVPLTHPPDDGLSTEHEVLGDWLQIIHNDQCERLQMQKSD